MFRSAVFILVLASLASAQVGNVGPPTTTPKVETDATCWATFKAMCDDCIAHRPSSPEFRTTCLAAAGRWYDACIARVHPPVVPNRPGAFGSSIFMSDGSLTLTAENPSATSAQVFDGHFNLIGNMVKSNTGFSFVGNSEVSDDFSLFVIRFSDENGVVSAMANTFDVEWGFDWNHDRTVDAFDLFLGVDQVAQGDRPVSDIYALLNVLSGH